MQNPMTALKAIARCAAFAGALGVAGCFGGGGGDDSGASSGGGAAGGGASVPPNSYVVQDQMTIEEAARFLNQATFGATEAEIDRLMEIGYSEWFAQQVSEPITPVLNTMLALEAAGGDPGRNELAELFWQRSIANSDQLRQRMAYALSQITVVSYDTGVINGKPLGFASYIDILNNGAFGNYRSFLEDITYSPMMAIYLTYLRNRKADPSRGTVPDENYAREIMQLFSIGLLELNQDGSNKLDGSNNPIETYSTSDVTELAKVFTGLSWKSDSFWGKAAP